MARPLLPMLLYLLMELGICCFCALNSGFADVKPHVFPEALVQCGAQAHNLVNTQAKFGPICMSGQRSLLGVKYCSPWNLGVSTSVGIIVMGSITFVTPVFSESLTWISKPDQVSRYSRAYISMQSEYEVHQHSTNLKTEVFHFIPDQALSLSDLRKQDYGCPSAFLGEQTWPHFLDYEVPPQHMGR